MEINGNRKGFVAAIDSMLAMVIAITFVGIVLTTFNEEVNPPMPEIDRQAMDVLTVLEYGNLFYSPTTAFAETSGSICLRLEIYNGTSVDNVAKYFKTSCPQSDTKETIMWRSFVQNGQMMTAKLAVWYKL